jgi:hypothetical protein
LSPAPFCWRGAAHLGSQAESARSAVISAAVQQTSDFDGRYLVPVRFRVEWRYSQCLGRSSIPSRLYPEIWRAAKRRNFGDWRDMYPPRIRDRIMESAPNELKHSGALPRVHSDFKWRAEAGLEFHSGLTAPNYPAAAMRADGSAFLRRIRSTTPCGIRYITLYAGPVCLEAQRKRTGERRVHP